MSKIYVKTTVDLHEGNLDKFRSIYPMKGSIKWFMNKCLEEFVDLHRIEKAPNDLVSFVVKDVLEASSPEDIDEEIEEEEEED